MNFESAVVEQALKELFNKQHFDICLVDKIGGILGVEPSQSPEYKYLRALHCVHFSDMRAEILDELQERVARCLRPQFDIRQLAYQLTAEGSNFTPIEDERFSNVKRIK